MDETELIAVTLTRNEWRAVQEALDEYFYIVEHGTPGGFRAATRERNAARRTWLLDALPRIDVAIYREAGVGPIVGDV